MPKLHSLVTKHIREITDQYPALRKVSDRYIARLNLDQMTNIMSSPTLTVALKNATTSNIVYAYITGYSLTRNNALVFISSDGVTPYYPPSPAAGLTVQPLPQDCAITLGPPGSALLAQIPQMAGARVYFSINNKLTFRLNPGPALVEPSVTNNSDPNINVCWAFAEFTFNDYQVFANISYVDFVSLPMAVSIETTDGRCDSVSGMAINGFPNIVAALQAQTAKDGAPWASLIVNNANGNPFRVLSPNNAIVLNPSLFSTYFDSYINQVYAAYINKPLSVDTQAQFGIVKGYNFKSGDHLIFSPSPAGDCPVFSKPTSADIFSCSTGPFADGSPQQLAITPRLAAGFNRATLLSSTTTPDPLGPASFYKEEICNHYARCMHEQLLDGRGYAFPYDDVAANGGPDQSGAVFDANTSVLTFAVGGNGAFVTPGAYGAPTYE